MVNLIVQAADFLFKAVLAYAKTPDGMKEFDDIWSAAHAAGLPVNAIYAEMTGQQPGSTGSTASQGTPGASSDIYGPGAQQVRTTSGG